ncbi:MAG: hypothetical protein ACTSVT_06265 [Candidatus Thorarchaeota archaeon]
MLLLLVAFIVALLIVIGAMPNTIRMLRERGHTGIDVHKPNRPDVPKGGGFVLLFAIVTALIFVIGVTTFGNGHTSPAILAALVSILMAGMIGLLDDNFDFRNRTKIVLPLLASIPMAALQVGTTTMHIPFIGAVNLGMVYPLVIVPLMMTFIIDSTNMYGGMNGLESGLAAINSSAIVAYVVLWPFFTGDGQVPATLVDAGTVAAALLGATVAFWFFNRYPAKVLPGDVGRLPIGAAMAAALVLGNMDRLAIILYAPFALNFLLYIVYRIYVKKTGIEYRKFAAPREDGTLEVVGPFTMYWILPYFMRIDEKRNVLLLLLIQAIIAYGATMILLLGHPFGVGWI